MGGIEFGKCEICGKETVLERTYFYYPIHYEIFGNKIKTIFKSFCERYGLELNID